MYFDNVLSVLNSTLYFTMIGVLLFVLPGLLVGFMISVFQAATQINETALSFLPKIIVLLLVIVWLAPWWLAQLVDFFREMMRNVPNLIG